MFAGKPVDRALVTQVEAALIADRKAYDAEVAKRDAARLADLKEKHGL